MAGLITVEAAQASLLAAVAPLLAESVPLIEAIGRHAAADVAARLTQPPFAASAMDGYAIRWADRAGPWRVVGEAAAGRAFAGEAVRIFTGAPLPAGADTVVVQEEVVASGGIARLTGEGPPREGAHIRIKGLDFAIGDRIVTAGSKITPARAGLLAAAGHGSVAVHRRPRVVLLATGDELVPPGSVPGADQIVSSNGVMLTGLLGGVAEIIDGGIVPDRRDALEAAVDAAAGADLLVTIGGASVGDHDLIMPVLTAMGADIDFWKVALRPGKPMLSGSLGGMRIVGLPGNPVSAFVCAALFVLPMLKRMAGDLQPCPALFTARLAEPLAANGGRQDYLRAVAHNTAAGTVVSAARRQDSGMLRTLGDSNVLVVRQPFAEAAEADATVLCHALDFVPGVA